MDALAGTLKWDKISGPNQINEVPTEVDAEESTNGAAGGGGAGEEEEPAMEAPIVPAVTVYTSCRPDVLAFVLELVRTAKSVMQSIRVHLFK